MDQYKQNAKWLQWFAPFRNLALSAAYLTPFFLQHGLDLTQIFLLQTIFSIAYLLWELPSGLIADRFGRALSIKLSVPIAAITMVAYGFSHSFWQFVICELFLAIANGLISGIDTALLYDSLKASRDESQFVKLSQRIDALGFSSVAAGVPLAVVLVHFFGVSATIIADGFITAVGAIFAFRLVEAPRSNGSQELVRLSAWHALKELSLHREVRWLVILGTVLSATTYLGFWLSAPYYTSLGIPVVWFSVILAIRNAWKAWLSHRFIQRKHIERNMVAYAILAGIVYFAMASVQIWLLWAVLGHDVVHALSSQPITAKLNTHIDHEFRATLNSFVNLIQRLVYSVVGPLVGLLVDRVGLSKGFLFLGIACSSIAFLAIGKLHKLKTFKT